MIKQTTKITAIIILAIGLVINAAAQQQQQQSEANCYAAVENISFTGVETATGTYEPTAGMFYGNAFVLKSSANNFAESETHHLTVSLDYSCALDNLCGESGHFPVTNGSWSLIVFRDNVYAGTLYGKVSGGAIDQMTNRNGQPGFRQTQIKLQTTGGLGRFADRRRNENISGVYEAVTDAVSNETTGSVNFTGGLE